MGLAQDRFKAVARDRWAPVLRDLGFKGPGKVFPLPDERDWAMLGFQTSTASTSEVAKFTVNLMVVGKEDWERARQEHRWCSAKPSPNTIALHRYQQRLGKLTHGEDHWWRLLGDGSNKVGARHRRAGQAQNQITEHSMNDESAERRRAAVQMEMVDQVVPRLAGNPELACRARALREDL